MNNDYYKEMYEREKRARKEGNNLVAIICLLTVLCLCVVAATTGF